MRMEKKETTIKVQCECGDKLYTVDELLEHLAGQTGIGAALSTEDTTLDELSNHDCHLSPEDGCDCQPNRW